jgi:diketogulonate reductase-like aldo/keto reductase
MENYILINNIEIPVVGFGTWHIKDKTEIELSIITAIENGYRHIDTASKYGNESYIGEVLKDNNIDRNNVFITSKLWNTDKGYENTLCAFKETLKRLQTDYLDLYLIHWAKTCDDWEIVNSDTWRAFEKIYAEGKVRAIGVSNFTVDALESLMKNCKIKPMVNQIEFHPGLMQKDILEYCTKNNILVEAWSPLGSGKMLNNNILDSISKKYNKSIAQLCIKWCLQNNVLPLPKSITPQRIIENIDVFNFIISDEDMATINSMEYFGGSGLDPNIIVKK